MNGEWGDGKPADSLTPHKLPFGGFFRLPQELPKRRFKA
jgi:hypothetical protein